VAAGGATGAQDADCEVGGAVDETSGAVRVEEWVF